ncbi:hypothetical protein BDQ17DRAFT_1544873 [Cyathus striatus]|nr:hypothetical protein BDQ17DRAFT_1544873 [Cyathus striatus]
MPIRSPFFIMVQMLPQKIIHLIIHEHIIQWDKNTIRSASLASRSFLEPCQQLLFVQVRLSRTNISTKIANWKKIIEPSPRPLATYIKELIFEDYPDLPSIGLSTISARDAKLFFSLSFSSLKSISLGERYRVRSYVARKNNSGKMRPYLDLLFSNHPGIEAVALCCVDMVPSASFIIDNPSLKYLAIHDLTSLHSTTPVEGTRTAFTDLNTLRIRITKLSDLNISTCRWLLNPLTGIDIFNLRNLSLVMNGANWPVSELDFWLEIINTCSSTLECLTISETFLAGASALPALHNLHALCFHCENFIVPEMLETVHLLSHTSRETLKDVVVAANDISYHPDEDDDDETTKSLQRSFFTSEFPSLEQFQVGTHLMPSSDRARDVLYSVIEPKLFRAYLFDLSPSVHAMYCFGNFTVYDVYCG